MSERKPGSATRDKRPPPVRRRQSLSHVGGRADLGGDRDVAQALAMAMDVERAPEAKPSRAPVEGPDRAHVHGFHAYPARMHPVTAARLVQAFAPPKGTVLDPFCGSGTVLVEALLAGRSAAGTDLNPLAIRLAKLKTRPHDARECERILEAAEHVKEFADERRTSRAGATRRFPKEDVDLFEPHVLLELDGLRAGIVTVDDSGVRADLELVLSALLVKLSKKEGDTSEEVAPRRTAAGYTAKLFLRKAEELAERLTAFARALPRPTPRVTVAVDDATKLASIASDSIDAVITSPPYVGTYDYVAHHALRMRWLDLDAGRFEAGELGARRHYTALTPGHARQEWAREVLAFLRASGRVVRPGGAIVLLMADSAIGREALRADDIVASVAGEAGLACIARASQTRPHFHAPTASAFQQAPRAEHALLLRRE